MGETFGLGHARGPNLTRAARGFGSELDLGSSPRYYMGVRPHGTIKKRLGALSSLVGSYSGNRTYLVMAGTFQFL